MADTYRPLAEKVLRDFERMLELVRQFTPEKKITKPQPPKWERTNGR